MFVFISIESSYINEINRTNPLGMNGLMAEEFADIIKQLWTSNNN